MCLLQSNLFCFTTQYVVPAEDDKGGSMGFSDQLPSAQGLLQSTGSQSPYSMAQVCRHFLVSTLSTDM